MPFKRLSIIGFGLLGASVARATRKHLPDCRVIAYDQDPDAVMPFTNEGIVGAVSVESACDQTDCVLLAVPPHQVPQMLSQLNPAIDSQVIITDVASVKRPIVAAAETMLRRPSQFVGGHPMAGGEKSGSAASRPDLFQAAAVVLTPTDLTDPQATDAVEKFWQLLGARVVLMSPEEHDRAVATVSHVPHALASALMHAAGGQFADLVGTGFRDMTRIAAGNPRLWRQILIDNRQEIRPVLNAIQQQLEHLAQLLDPEQAGALEHWLAEAAQARQALGTTDDGSGRARGIQ